MTNRPSGARGSYVAQTVQGKVQMLGLLMVVFILLSLPLFAQVRADARSSAERGNDTMLGRLFQDLFKNMKGEPPNVEVEDAWGDWQKQNPGCSGAQCGADGDLDGDGISNKDELARGRNPTCHEEKEGANVCKGRPTNGTTPTPTATPRVPPLDQEILDGRGPARVAAPFESDVRRVTGQTPDYTRWVMFWNATELTGTGGYSLDILRSDGSVAYTVPDSIPAGVRGTDGGQVNVTPVPPSDAFYRLRVTAEQGLEGTWHVEVRGYRAAS